MKATPPAERRARPLLGTLVEVGIAGGPAAHEAAFAAVAQVQARMSRFEPASAVARFAALPAGAEMTIDAWAAAVLAAARALHEASGGRFDVALGTGRWQLDGHCLHKLDAGTRLDLGGIAKGYAIDRAVQALRDAGADAGWVNAGGDLRVFGALSVPLMLRDEAEGGTRVFGTLSDGACATSRLAPGARCQAWDAQGRIVDAHVSVLAPEALWADALTKLVALEGRTDHPLLAQHGAQAWLH